MSDSELRALAYQVFLLTRREVWRGGKVGNKTTKGRPTRWENQAWPAGLDRVDWNPGVTWTLSPPVELGGHELQVCISSSRGAVEYGVRVFIDGDLKYPGGYYVGGDWWFFSRVFPSWAGRIADMERRDGGVSGPIDRRDQLITEARERLRGQPTQVNHPKQIEERPMDEAAVRAVREVEDLVKKTSNL